MFSYLQTNLSGWQQFPSLAAGALSSGLQRRVISYLLRRLLGHFVKGGELNLDQIEAAIGNGRVEIRNVDLNPESITAKLPPLVQVESGSVGSISIQIPWTGPWSGGEVVVKIADPRLTLSVCDDPSSNSARDGRTMSSADDAISGAAHSSLILAAEEVLYDDPEGRQLEQHIEASILEQEQQQAGTSTDTKQTSVVQPRTLVESIVDRLLARLRVSVSNTVVVLRGGAASDANLDLEVKLGQIDVVSTPSDEQQSVTRSDGGALGSESARAQTNLSATRTITIHDVGVWTTLTPLAPTNEHGRETAEEEYDDEEEEEEEEEEPEAYMEMSQAIPDLRHSQMQQSMLSEASTSASMYASALEEESPSVATSAHKVDLTPKSHQIFSIASDPIILKITEPSLNVISDSGRIDDTEFKFEAEFGNVAGFLEPSTAGALFSLVENVLKFMTRQEEEDTSSFGQAPATARPRSPFSLTCNVNIRGAHLLCAYEPSSNLEGQRLALFDQSMTSFWQRPARVHPSIGHLRLRLDAISGSWKVSKNEAESHAVLKLGDVGFFEHLSPMLVESTNLASVLPLAVFDYQLMDQYSSIAPLKTASKNQTDRQRRGQLEAMSIDAFDWRSVTVAGEGSRPGPYWKAGYGERGWKLKPKHRRSTSTTSTTTTGEEEEGTARLVVEATLGSVQDCRVNVAPLHVFLDVSTVDRILPLLRSLSRNARTENMSRADSDLAQSFETLHAPSSPLQRISGSLSLEHIGDASTAPTTTEIGNKSSLSVLCDLVRIELRVPLSIPRLGIKRSKALRRKLLGLDVRTGIVILDAQKVKVDVQNMQHPQQDAIPDMPAGSHPFDLPALSRGESKMQHDGLAASIDQVTLFYKAASDNRSSVFAILGKLTSAEPSSAGPAGIGADTDEPQPPRLVYSNQANKASTSGNVGGVSGARAERGLVDCQLPALRVSLSKELLDGLELMADDLTLWSSGLGADDESETDNGTEALKILGSRFFGSKHSISALSGSSASTEVARRSASVPALSLSVSEVLVSLLVPRRHAKPTDQPRELGLSLSELKVFIDTKHAVGSTMLELSILTATLDDRSKGLGSQSLVTRTLEQSLSRGVRPVVKIVLISTTEIETTNRESKVDILVEGLTLSFDGDQSLLQDLLIFGRSPEGAFEHVQPNEVTRIAVRVKDNSVLLAPLGTDARGVLVIGDFKLKTNLIPDYPKTSVRASLSDAAMLVAEKMQEPPTDTRRRARSTLEHWGKRGMMNLVTAMDVRGAVVMSTLTRPDIDVDVTRLHGEVKACADSFTIVASLVEALTPISAPSSPSDSQIGGDVSRRRRRESSFNSSSSSTSPGEDLLASVDEGAFAAHKASTFSSTPDLVEDDIPRNLDYLASSKNESRADSPDVESQTLYDEDVLGSESIESLARTAPKVRKMVPSPGTVLFQDDIVTVRLLDPKGIRPRPGYFTDLEQLAQREKRSNEPTSSLRVKLSGCELALRLFDGYDCPSTRSAFEEEARRLKRRLQKIEQMLHQGQTPDDSVEEVAADLLASLHISAPVEATEAGEAGDPTLLMQAIEEELGDQSETASSDSTWQPFPPGHHSAMRRDRSSSSTNVAMHPKRRRNKLMRSSRSKIDFVFKGVTAEFNKFGKTSDIESKALVTARSFKILDQMSTSTWNTFLTRRAQEPDSRIPPEAWTKDMVRVKIVNVRPGLESETATATAMHQLTSPRSEASSSSYSTMNNASIESRFYAKVAPLKLHVDQDALDFLKKFFAFKPPSTSASSLKRANEAESGERAVGPFIQHAEVWPVHLSLDYKGKRPDLNKLKRGEIIEMMNFFNFEGAEMTLRHLTLRGITGWARLFDTMNDIWTPDVKANQLVDVLSGIAQVKSIINVGQGMADLILTPLEHYQRDGNVLRGLQKGTRSFVKNTTLEAVKLGARLATGTQVLLERAEDVLGGNGAREYRQLRRDLQRGATTSSSSAASATSQQQRRRRDARSSRGGSASQRRNDDEEKEEEETEEEESEVDEDRERRQFSRYAHPPSNFREGLTQAQTDLLQGFKEGAQTILAVPMEVYERGGGGPGGASGGAGESSSSSARTAHDSLRRGNGSGGERGGGGGGGSRPVLTAVPIAALRGAAGASGAVGTMLMALRTDLGGNRNEVEEEKFKKP